MKNKIENLLPKLIMLILSIFIIWFIAFNRIKDIYSMESGNYGCFGGQPKNEIEEKVTKASFSVLHLVQNKPMFEGGSATLLSGGNGYVLTAKHLLHRGEFYIKSYDGSLILKMKPIYLGIPSLFDGISNLYLDDVAILAPDEPESSQNIINLKKMEGLDIVKNDQYVELFIGKFGKPGGPDVGASGASMNDLDGNIIGIIVGSVSPSWPINIIAGYGGGLSKLPYYGWGAIIGINKIASEYANKKQVNLSGKGIMASHPYKNCVFQHVEYESYSNSVLK